MTDAHPTHQQGTPPEIADLSNRLYKLSVAALLLVPDLKSEELKHRCSVLASGAKVAAGLLTQMPLAIAVKPEIHHDAVALNSSTSDGIETRLLYHLGWSAMELGLKTEALAVLQMVGTLLHGEVGGTIFKVESLVATGKLAEAAALYKVELPKVPGGAEVADAVFASLWNHRGDTLWSVVKISAS